jgi:uncharacterized protein YggT (Ycf19 family)
MEFITTHKSIVVFLHALFAAGGLGAVVVTDALFFKFLKDFKINKKEDETLRTISSIVWVLIVLLLITGVLLFLTSPMDYLAKSKFVTKLVIFGIIILNGGILNWIITPYLRKIAFGPVDKQPERKLRFLRRIAFASGGISFVSWFLVFLLGSLRSIPLTAGQALGLYAVLLAAVVFGSQLYATWVKYHKH